jgi:hypothetical protein
MDERKSLSGGGSGKGSERGGAAGTGAGTVAGGMEVEVEVGSHGHGRTEGAVSAFDRMYEGLTSEAVGVTRQQPPHGRGLHSFTLELILSNSRTHS